MGLKLSQLIDVNLKSQIMTTNMWVEQEWNDYKLRWDPEEYGGVSKLHVPAEQIWLPDIVLYNNADGNYEVTIMTKAILHHDGLVVWKPPAIYKSSCEIDVKYFPFDQQTCWMKFGSWTYDGYTVDLKHKNQQEGDLIEVGIDLSEFYLSVEWDIMAVRARRKEKFYSCCEEPYPDITFNITIRRKTLFYTVNLIIPCVAISFLSILVFYLPSDSGEKVSLSINIMLSLGVFFLLLSEIIPPTSLAVPLLGKYLLFTMVLVSFSVFVTIAVLNVNFRSPATHKMPLWVKEIFCEWLPGILMMKRPEDDEGEKEEQDRMGVPQDIGESGEAPNIAHNSDFGLPVSFEGVEVHPTIPPLPPLPGFPDVKLGLMDQLECSYHGSPYPLECNDDGYGNDSLMEEDDDDDDEEDEEAAEDDVEEAEGEIEMPMNQARFVAKHMKNVDKFDKISEDWQYIAMVLDRVFLIAFTLACVLGSASIIFEAPSLFDDKVPIDVLLSKVAPRAVAYRHEMLSKGIDLNIPK
ncbi:acetylcholine receptor subunit alpha-like 1 [Galendromus occidentalis]|uniref:Acetylcholine receptor subunit alpha-like 1 n=1 Tax=Galendromus occidentalis TaxID=34638 RepID=A0AAJ7WK05_9ACAR|nr:acetylcholine receptor subunit alpha-like 1 [Galendromus occidentalis]